MTTKSVLRPAVVCASTLLVLAAPVTASQTPVAAAWGYGVGTDASVQMLVDGRCRSQGVCA